jgi:hypothetical protein
MAIHYKDHALNSGDHQAGTTPGTNEINVIGTSDAPAVVEVTVEAPGTGSTDSKIVRRAADGHIAVPTSGQTDAEVLSKQQVESLIAEGVWKSPAHSFVADHTSSSVGDGGSGGPPLVVGDIVVNTTDQKVYEVTSIAGGQTGDLVTWDAGYTPTTQEVRINKLTDETWTYDTDTSAWINQGSSNHARQHAMTSTADHTAGNWKVFHSNGSGEVIELALPAAGAPLVGQGTSAAPVFGNMYLGDSVVVAAGATPVDTDVSAWGNNTVGIVVGTGGRVFFTFKNATDVYYIEATAI